MKKVLITGYYGFHNLGDDILLLCSFRLLKAIAPEADIWILTESNQPHYILKLLGEDVKIINNSSSQHFDVIIHGGGGVHFGFEEGTRKYLWLNKLIQVIGINNFRQLFNLYKKLKGRTNITSDRRIGIGIGVGTFTPSSQKFYNNIQILADYDALFVRDKQSFRNIQRYRFKYPTYVSTDLAFLRNCWLPQLPAKTATTNNKVGLVLRDWRYDGNAHFAIIKEVCRNLTKKGYQITCYALDSQMDLSFIKEFAAEYDMIVWQPEQMTLYSFLAFLQQEDIIVSSRAHGAIVGACIGTPVVCLGIEPKLQSIFNMLQQSAAYVPIPLNASELIDLVEGRFSCLDQYRELTRKDVQDNEGKIRKCANQLRVMLR